MWFPGYYLLLLELVQVFCSRLDRPKRNHDSYFANSTINMNISVVNDLDVHVGNGTFNILQVNFPKEGPNSLLESMKKKLSGEMVNSVSNLKLTNFTLDSKIDLKAKGESGGVRITGNYSAPSTSKSDDLTSYTASAKALSTSTEIPKSLVRVQADDNRGGKRMTVSSHRDCTQLSYSAVTNVFDQQVSDLRVRGYMVTELGDSKRTMIWNMAQAVCIEYCMKHQIFASKEFAEFIAKASIINLLVGDLLVKIKKEDLTSYQTDLALEVSAVIGTDILAELAAVSQKVYEDHTKVVKRIGRSLLETDDDEEVMGFSDLSALAPNLNKAIRMSRNKLDRLRRPIETMAVEAPKLTPSKSNLTTSDPNLHKILDSGNFDLVEFLHATPPHPYKNYRFRVGEHHNYPNRTVEGIKVVLKLSKCEGTLHPERSLMSGDPTAVIYLSSVGSKLCVVSVTCNIGFGLTKDGVCLSVTTDRPVVNVNFKAMSLNPEMKVSDNWSSSRLVKVPDNSSEEVICTIDGQETGLGSEKCDSPNYLKRTLLQEVTYLKSKNGDQLVSTSHLTLKPLTLSKSWKSYSCGPSGECGNCLTSASSDLCNGDTSYCSMRKNCDEMAPCYCNVNPEVESFCYSSVSQTNSDYEKCEEAKFVIFKWSRVEVARKKPEREVHVKADCRVDSECRYGKVIYSSNCAIVGLSTTFRAREVWTKITEDQETVKKIEVVVPWDLVLKENTYRGEVHFKDATQESVSVSGICQPFRVCDQIECVYCKEYIQSIRCWTAGTQALMFIGLPVIFVALLGLFFKLMLKVKVLRRAALTIFDVIWYLLCPAHFLFHLLRKNMRRTVRVARKHKGRLVDYHKRLQYDSDSPDEEKGLNTFRTKVRDFETTPIIRSDTPPKTRSKRTIPIMYTMILMIFLITAQMETIEACHDAYTIIMNNKDCKGKECVLTSDVKAKIEHKDQILCLIVRDEKDVARGNLIITIENIFLSCSKSIKYYTFDASPVLKTSSNCYRKGFCQDGPSKACELFNDPKTSSRALIFSSSLKMLNVSSCEAATGCWANNCLTCSDGCAFSLAEIKNPTGRVYEVSKCTQWNYVVTGKVNSGLTSVRSIRSFRIKGPERHHEDDIEINISSGSVPPSEVTNKCFLNDGKYASMVDCQSTGMLVTGVIGEVRCPSKKSAEYPGLDCSMANDIINLRRVGWDWEIKGSFVSVFDQHMQNLLPKSYGSYLLNKSKNEIVASISSEMLLEMNVKIKNAKVQMLEFKHECSAKRAKVEGCYACDEGAELTIEIDVGASSETTSMTAYLRCESSQVSATIPVEKSIKVYKTHVSSQFNEIKELCLFSCGSRAEKVKVEGVLIEKMYMSPLHSVIISSSDNKSAGDLEFQWPDWLSFESPMKILAYFLLGLFLFLTFLSLIKILLQWLISRKKQK